MNVLPSGADLALLIVLMAVLVHEPWRWLGLYLGRDLDVASDLFQWIRAVATALVAGLVMRLVLFPAGALAGVPLWGRVGGLAIGIGAYLVARGSLPMGVAAGTLALMLSALLGG